MGNEFCDHTRSFQILLDGIVIIRDKMSLSMALVHLNKVFEIRGSTN